MPESEDKTIAEEIAKGIEHGGMAYHDVPEFGIKGRRDNEHRLKQLNLGDLTGKTVMDIGCNSGWFCKKAIELGAAWSFGYDRQVVVNAAKKINHMPGVSLFGRDVNQLTSESIGGPVSIILFLSMFKLLGLPHFLSVADHLVMENNSTRFEDYIFFRLHRLGFSRVEHCGYTTDFGKRSIIKAWKK